MPHQRDRIMATALRVSAVLMPLGGLACLALARHVQIAGGRRRFTVGGVLTLWLTAACLASWATGWLR